MLTSHLESSHRDLMLKYLFGGGTFLEIAYLFVDIRKRLPGRIASKVLSSIRNMFFFLLLLYLNTWSFLRLVHISFGTFEICLRCVSLPFVMVVMGFISLLSCKIFIKFECLLWFTLIGTSLVVACLDFGIFVRFGKIQGQDQKQV